MLISMDIQDKDLFDDFDELEKQFKIEVRKSLIVGLTKVKGDAKRDHKFHNRTGRLESHIKATLEPDTNKLEGYVYVNDLAVPYGKYVHNGTRKMKSDPFLTNAMVKNEKYLIAKLEEAVNKAIKDSNLSSNSN
jgi:HK97 gp10 family phage protein